MVLPGCEARVEAPGPSPCAEEEVGVGPADAPPDACDGPVALPLPLPMAGDVGELTPPVQGC